MISVNNLRWTPFRLHNDGLSYSKAKPLFKQDYYDDSWRHRHECLQWLTKVVETLKENYAFRNLISYSISFVSSVNPVIPPPLNSILCRCCDLCSRKNRKINIVSGKKAVLNGSRTFENWISCLNTLVAHCRFTSLPVLIGRWRQDKFTSV